MIRSPAGFEGVDRIKRYQDYFQDGYGASMLSLTPFGTDTVAGNLLGSEPSGMAVDFTAGGAMGNLLVRSAQPNSVLDYNGTPFQIYGGDILYSRSGTATVVDSDNKIKWAPHNYLLASEQLSITTYWAGSVSNTTITSNELTAPDGTISADKLVGTAVTTLGTDTGSKIFYLANLYSGLNISTSVTGGIWLYAPVAGTYQIALFQWGGGNYYQSVTLAANTWTLATATTAFGTTAGNIGIAVYSGNATLYLWGAHLYRSDLNGMQANATQFPYYNPTTPKNYVGYSESLTNAAWALIGGGATAAPTRTTYTGVLPNGLTGTVVRLSIPVGVNAATDYSFMYNSTTLVQMGAAKLTASIYIKRVSGGTKIGLGAESTTTSPATSGYIASLVDVPDTWTRVSVSNTITNAPAGNWLFVIGLDGRLAAQRNQSAIVVDIWGASLTDTLSLTPYVGSYGAAPSATAYQGPRLDFAGGTPRGLLIEEARNNILLNSVTLATQNVTVSATAYTLSFYGSGTITLSGTSTAGPLVGVDANTRVSLTFTPTAGTLTLTVSGSVTYAQLEAGAFATSYIFSGSTSGSRSADVATFLGIQFPFSSTDGTLIVAFDTAANAPGGIIGDNTAGSVFAYGAGNNFRTYNGASVLGTANSLTANATMKGAISYSASGRSIVLNGGAVVSDGDAFQSGATGLNLGYVTFTGGYINGHIRQLTYTPRRLSDDEIKAKTA